MTGRETVRGVCMLVFGLGCVKTLSAHYQQRKFPGRGCVFVCLEDRTCVGRDVAAAAQWCLAVTLYLSENNNTVSVISADTHTTWREVNTLWAEVSGGHGLLPRCDYLSSPGIVFTACETTNNNKQANHTRLWHDSLINSKSFIQDTDLRVSFLILKLISFHQGSLWFKLAWDNKSNMTSYNPVNIN